MLAPILALIFSINKEVLVSSKAHSTSTDNWAKSGPDRVFNQYKRKIANFTQIRAYSTVSNRSLNKGGGGASSAYFKLVKSKDPNSPNGIVTNFHLKYNSPELAYPYITYELIKSILGGILDGFDKVMNKNIFQQLKELADSTPCHFSGSSSAR